MILFPLDNASRHHVNPDRIVLVRPTFDTPDVEKTMVFIDEGGNNITLTDNRPVAEFLLALAFHYSDEYDRLADARDAARG